MCIIIYNIYTVYTRLMRYGMMSTSEFRMLSSSYIGEAVVEHLDSIPNHMNPKALHSWGCFKTRARAEGPGSHM